MKLRVLFLYGLSLAIILFTIRTLELNYILYDLKSEIFISLIACLFTGIGIWLALNLFKKEVMIKERIIRIKENSEFVLNTEAVLSSGLSKRELEVLQLISEGMSNEEIGDKLSLALPTIKTHVSKVYEKLEVKRRIQAVEKARVLDLIP